MMSKIFRTTITLDISPDQNDWLDFEEMTEDDLIEYAKGEMVDFIYECSKHNEVFEIIDVEIINEDN
jgi:hypothetical protein